MIEALRTISSDLNWRFSYGRQDFNNLVQAESDTDTNVYLFLDPVTEDGPDDEGMIEYSGKLMLLVQSKADEMYDNQQGIDPSEGRWQKHIKPIKEEGGLLDQLTDQMDCVSLYVKRWRKKDVINFLTGFDGVIVDYSIESFR